MRILDIAGATTRFVAEGCNDLPAIVSEGVTYTYWQPEPEDMAALLAGLPIRVAIASEDIFPMLVTVEAL
jgi:hypothetical protein